MGDDLIVDVEMRFPAGFVIQAALRTSIERGGVLVLFGPSGSGKTTLIRAIAGLERPARGTIACGAETWFDAARSVFLEPQRRRVGYVFQDTALFPHLTVRRNIEYGIGRLQPRVRAGRVEEMLEMVESSDLAERHPRQLSGGQAQRVALGRALAPRPRLLLLDEPFAALDAPARVRMRRMLRSAVDRLAIPSVLVTHDRNEAIALGDQMAVLAEGRIRQVGPVLEVLRRPADLVVARSVGIESVVPAEIERVDQGLVDLRVGGTTLRAVEVELDRDTRQVFACIRAEDVTIERSPASNASARNHLPGRITSIESDGPIERVIVDCGFPLAALITRHAREELALHEGASVVAAIKATAVHLVPKA